MQTSVAKTSKPDDTRDRLLHAAAEIFAEKGFAATTVREICLRAPANLALINYYFGDKLELYKEVLQKAILDEGPGRKMQPIEANPEEELRQMILAMLERSLDQSKRSSLRYRMMMQEFAHPSRATDLIVDLTLKPVYDRLREIVARILHLPPGHTKARLAAHSIIGQVVHFAHSGPVMPILWPQMKMTAAQRKLIATHIADLTLSYLRAQQS
jgi:TetR/AcrR family transcriptional regulator, regulator of cefoperazone and chloramphenicol sensitivity